jgi:Thiamine pyrophosphate enzyme, N-terminal TPP binding domain
MATAHAEFTGEVGVCLATSGPGAIHLLNGLYDAAYGQPGTKSARARSLPWWHRRGSTRPPFQPAPIAPLPSVSQV